MSYPIKTLSQLPIILKGFRKEKHLTQAAMGEKLGITQQSYAAFEANPAMATLDRLVLVLRLLDVEMSLDQVNRASVTGTEPLVNRAGDPMSKAGGQKSLTTSGAEATTKKKTSTAANAGRIVAPTRKKESW